MTKNIVRLELCSAILFALLVICFTFVIIPAQISVTGSFPNQRTFPFTASLILCGLSFLWIGLAVKKGKPSDDRAILKGIGIGFLLLCTVLLYDQLGYLVAGFITAAVVVALIDRRHVISIAVFSLVLTLLYYLFFTQLLNIQFPTGHIF